MKRFISLILAAVIILTALLPFFAYADEKENTIYITEEQLQKKPGKKIDTALLQARDTGTKKNPVTVILPSGTYTLEKTLHIYSNTILVLQSDTTLIRGFSEVGNLLKAGRQEEYNSGYSGYENITVSGGIWDGDFSNDSCGMRFAHCSNITLENLTIKNIKNSHHMELAASNRFKIINCAFTGYKRTKGGDGEAVQIDPLHNTEHFPSYMYYDDTPCKNITVSGCYFSDVYAGVGTRSGVVGSYFENIRIIDNIFDNITDKAICGFNYRNSVIKNNMINNATLGIILEYFPSYNVTGKLFNPNDSTADTTIIQDTNTVVSGNFINITKKTYRVNTGGILVYGAVNTKAMSKENRLPRGRYIPTGLKIRNNTIITRSPQSRGIYFDRVDDSKVYNNEIRCTAEINPDINGIMLISSNGNLFSNNTVKGYYNGVLLQSRSKENILKTNIIKNCKNYGISIDKKSNAVIHSDNTLKRNTSGAIKINKRDFKIPKKAPVLDSAKSEGNVTLFWNENQEVSNCNIYRSKRRSRGYRLYDAVVGSETVTYTDVNTEKSKRYYYKVEPYLLFRNSIIYTPKSEYTTVKA